MFGDKALPPYEVNTRTVEILCQLAEWNEARDKDLTLVIEDQKIKTSEIKAEGDLIIYFFFFLNICSAKMMLLLQVDVST